MAQKSCNLDKEEAEILKPSSSSSPPTPPQSSSSSSSQPQAPPLFMNSLKEFSAKKAEKRGRSEEEGEELRASARVGNRCSSCRKKVGLTGFRCRCGDLFCGRHRYSDSHDCSFDYKAFGREQISKANPVIRAAKIIKI